MKKAAKATYGRKGDKIVQMNYDAIDAGAVSYTHLDVYKRQVYSDLGKRESRSGIRSHEGSGSGKRRERAAVRWNGAGIRKDDVTFRGHRQERKHRWHLHAVRFGLR